MSAYKFINIIKNRRDIYYDYKKIYYMQYLDSLMIDTWLNAS